MTKNIKPDEKCKGCKYLVDWHDMPYSTGYSVATQTGEWFGCMKFVATINHLTENDIHAIKSKWGIE